MKTSLAIVCLSLSSALSSAAALAQQPPPAPPKPAAATPRASIVSRPSLEPVQQAFLGTRLREVRAVLVVTYDAAGVPTDFAFDPPSGSEALDRAILEWGRQVRLTPGKAGTGRIPFNLVDDSADTAAASATSGVPTIPADRIETRPPLQPVLDAMAAVGAASGAFELLLFYDREGRVIDATLGAGARGDGVDRAVLAWARQLKLKPGSAGAGRTTLDVRNALPGAADRQPQR